jgi:oxygen-independent coproporphyrinogen-3 oxidase
MVPRQDDGLASDQYRLAEELLGAAGYRHYELSSWALPEKESRHNLAYWARRAYTGIGAGAHSYDGAAERSWNRRDLDGYVEAAEAGERPMVEREELDERTRAFEAVALSLRRVTGMSRREFRDEFGADPVERYAKAVSETIGMGLLEVDGDTVRLSADGRLFASEVLVSFAG